MRQNTVVAINAADASVNELGIVIDSAFIISASAIAVSTGSSTGTINIQGSNDLPAGLAVTSLGHPIPVNWINITSLTATISAATIAIIPAFQVCYRWLRVSYVKNNGSAGTITVNMQTQGED